ncbi:MAG: hypothetical protein HN576_05500 [Bacteriovoracaceae bacterium]|nr:hypothetical protein [Bacteriovoracaceae bacterium]
MVKHDFTAFNKALSKTERATLNKISNYYLDKTNLILRLKNIAAFQLEDISFSFLSDFHTMSGDVIVLNSKVSVLLSSSLASVIMDAQLGKQQSENLEDNNFSEGAFGKNVIMTLFSNTLETFKIDNCNMKFYSSLREWELSLSGFIFISMTFTNKNKNQFKILIDQMYKNWLLSQSHNAS